MSKRDKQKLRYLRRLRTFYNPIDEIFVEELDDISEEEEEEGAKIVPILPVKMASSQEVEALLKQYSKRKPKLNALEPTMFEGSITENPKTWLKRFNNYTLLNKIEEKDKILMFEGLLSNASQCWFNNLDVNDKKTFASIENQFLKTYEQSNSWINDQRLENRRLRPGESCTSYINNIIDLAQLAGVDDKEIRKAMIRGLPEEIKYQIVTHNPQNLDETIQRIMLCESMTKTKEDATLCSIDERILSTKMDGFVNKLTSSLDAIEKTFQQFRDTADTIKKTDHQEEHRKCGICNRTNHKEENCYYKQYNRNQQFRPNERFPATRRGGYPRRGYQNNQGRRDRYPPQYPNNMNPYAYSTQQYVRQNYDVSQPYTRYPQPDYNTMRQPQPASYNGQNQPAEYQQSKN